VRLNQSLQQKTAIVRAHFAETARRNPTGAKKPGGGGGFSLFGGGNNTRDAEIAEAMQMQLEESLADGIHLTEANTQLRNELNAAYALLDRAVLLGFDPNADGSSGQATPGRRASEEVHNRLTPSQPSRTPLGTTPRPGLGSGGGGYASGQPNLPSHLEEGDGFDD
jgi:hypothetical protein